MTQLDKRSRKNVLTNVKNTQHKGKDGERKNLNYSYKWKEIQCLNSEDFGHIQVECSSVPREQRRISNVSNDYEGEDDQGNDDVSFEDMHTGEQSNSKKKSIASI